MAEALYLCSKTPTQGERLINGVRYVLINKDDGQTATQIRTSASAQASAAFAHTGLFPDGYFDATPDKVSDLTAGTFKDNLDAMVFPKNGPSIKVEG